MLFFPTRYTVFKVGCFFFTSASSRTNVVSWLTVRTAMTIRRPFRSPRSAATTLDLPLPVGASIMPIPPSRATVAANASISRWCGRYSLYGKKGSKLSITGNRLAAGSFMSVGRGESSRWGVGARGLPYRKNDRAGLFCWRGTPTPLARAVRRGVPDFCHMYM